MTTSFASHSARHGLCDWHHSDVLARGASPLSVVPNTGGSGGLAQPVSACLFWPFVTVDQLPTIKHRSAGHGVCGWRNFTSTVA